jgi:hypothetical protein
MTRTQWAAAAAAMLLAGTALAATPAEKCASSKNDEAGRYAECRHKAAAKLALTSDGAAHARALQKCADRYARKWPAIESKAGGSCPSAGDLTVVQQYLDTAAGDVAAALAGGTLAASGHRLKTGQTQCHAAAFPYGIVPCPGTGQDGELQRGLDRAYVDNGDGTITDARTGLMWEKLSDDGSIHDKDRTTYSRTDAVAVKAAGLNQQAFAGYTDWRVPNVAELQTLASYGARNPAVPPVFHTGCVPGCTVLTCSCTNGYAGYWSASVVEVFPTKSWVVELSDGAVRPSTYTGYAVRAVRGGS